MQSSLEHDALSLHFVMAYPNLQGIHLKDAALPVYSKEASEASAASRQKFLSVLSFLDSKKLNEEERYTYDLLCDRLALDLEESDFSYYEEPPFSDLRHAERAAFIICRISVLYR